MKTVKIATLLIMAAAITIAMPAAVLADPYSHSGAGHYSHSDAGHYSHSDAGHYSHSGAGRYYHSGVRIGIGFGYYDWPGYYPYYYPYYPYYYPGVVYVEPYYPPPVVAAPVVVQQPAVVYTAPAPAPVQDNNAPALVDEHFLEYARNKKAELIKQVQSADKAERIKAIVDMAGLTFDEAVRENLKSIATKDTDPDLRREVVRALGKSKNPQVIPILEEVRVNDDNKEIRQAADQAIKDVRGIQ